MSDQTDAAVWRKSSQRAYPGLLMIIQQEQEEQERGGDIKKRETMYSLRGDLKRRGRAKRLYLRTSLLLLGHLKR